MEIQEFCQCNNEIPLSPHTPISVSSDPDKEQMQEQELHKKTIRYFGHDSFFLC